MVRSKIEKIADLIVDNDSNHNVEKEVIVYGLNSAIEQGICFILFIVLGCFFRLLIESIVFIVSFTFIRIYAGGYHCKKNTNCYLSSSVVVFCVLMIIKYFPVEYRAMTGGILVILSILVLYTYAPIETKSKPLDEIEYKFYRKKTLFNLKAECAMVMIIFLINYDTIAFTMCLGIAISAGVVIRQVIDFYNNC